MKPDEQRMRDVLVDTIRLLCRTGIDYSRRLRVQGLLGITVDDEHVFLIHVDDFIARNCTEVDTSVCGFVDDCGGAGRARVNSDVVGGASTGSVDHHNVPEDIRDNCTNQCQSTSAVQQPKQTLSQSTHTDVLTSVAMSEISAAVAATAETRDFPSSQMLSHNAQNVPLYENISPPVAAENCSESQSAHFTSNGNTTAPESCASPSVPQTSVPNEVTSNDRSEIPIPVFVRMEMDGRVDGKSAENVVVTLRDDLRRSDVAMCATDVGSENRCMLSNLDDVDSCTDDGDSDRTSESDDVPDHLALPPLELISSLQYQPQALVGNASRWQIGGVQQPCGSDTGTDPVTIQPAVLTGVSGSHASAYYQQQILAAAAAAAHNRAARAAATSVKSMPSATESASSIEPPLPLTVKHNPPLTTTTAYTFQRRLPRRPRESQDKRFRCPFCELAYYHKKHLKYHLTKKHGF